MADEEEFDSSDVEYRDNTANSLDPQLSYNNDGEEEGQSYQSVAYLERNVVLDNRELYYS
jgi:hypothetical protein